MGIVSPGHRLGPVAALLLAILIGGIAAVAAQEVSIKILVNDEPISDYDIDQRERFLAITTQQQPSPALKKQASDMLIDERLQIQEGRKVSVTPPEEDVDAILADMAQKNNLDVQGLATALGKAGVNIKTLKDRVRAQLVWQTTVQKKFRREVQIADIEVEQAMAEAAPSEGGAAAEPALQLRQIKYALPSGADQRTIAGQLAAAEAMRARFKSCADLASGVQGATVNSIQDYKTASLAQPARLLVTNAKVGQITPPTITQAAVELYAVCGKRSVGADGTAREQVQRQLMSKEMGLRAERLLRDVRAEAFIEYR
ncbi:MAG: SurA N-terminal domain-containing protein [Methyloceanibacter sp.]